MTLDDTLASTKLKARIAGGLYVFIIAAGIFSESFVRDALIEWHDAPLTAHNILAHDVLYRLGFTADLLTIIAAIISSVLIYQLLRPVGRAIALLALAFDLISNTIEVTNLLTHFAPLQILATTPALVALDPAQRAALALLSLELHHTLFMILLAIFGVACVLYGYLIYRATFLPRFLGVLLALAGVCYLINSFAIFLAPALASVLFPYILLPCVIGEAALALWLLIAGVNVERWTAVLNATRGG